MKPNTINIAGMRVAYHEASHAVILHIMLGDDCIKYITLNDVHGGKVQIKDGYRIKYLDSRMLAGLLAGWIGEKVFTGEHINAKDEGYLVSDYSAGDMAGINEIVEDRRLAPAIIQTLEARLVTAMQHPLISEPIKALGAFLYGKFESMNLMEGHYIKRPKGSTVHKLITDAINKAAYAGDKSGIEIEDELAQLRCSLLVF